MSADMHDAAGHLTALGWTTFALYLIAALLCFHTAEFPYLRPLWTVVNRLLKVRSRLSVVRSPSTPNRRLSSEMRRIWSLLALILAILGLNKPIDMQTRLIELGRQIADQANLSAQSAWLHVLFFMGFLFLLAAFFLLVLLRFRVGISEFIRHQPVAAVGCALICVYVLLRAVSIVHVDQMAGFDLGRIPFLWLLETGGLALIIGQTFWDFGHQLQQ